MTEYLLWFFNTTDPTSFWVPTLRTFSILVCLYQFDCVFLVLRFFVHKTFAIRRFTGLEAENRLSAMLALPTMLRNKSEMEGIKRAIESAANNQYPGVLYIVCSIDDRQASGLLYDELQDWIQSYKPGSNVSIYMAASRERQGKAMAIEGAVRTMQSLVEAKEVLEFPRVFFNMDADSVLAPQTLERMVFKLTKRSRITKKRPMIVASNVKIARKHYWHGWKGMLSMRGWLSLLISNEYMTAISAAKHNSKLIPVIVASGALYCTWSEFPRMSARYAAFMQTLRCRDFLAWLIGKKPPCFSTCQLKPLPEAQTGEGDDAWMTWFACSAIWKGDSISVNLPRSPWHAFWRMILFWFFRPLAYDPKAKVYTSSPDKSKALFKQRIRWNGSRIWGIQRWRGSFLFNWGIGSAVLANSLLFVVIYAVVFVSLLLFPFRSMDMHFFPFMLIAYVTYVFVRTQSLVIALLYDEDVRSQWQKILVLPLMPIYHFVFNVLPCIVAMSRDIFWFGSNTHFAPAKTLVRGRTSRIAIVYRLRRFFVLALRSVFRGDVRPGWFWLGWFENEYTTNGYQDWDLPRKKKSQDALTQGNIAKHRRFDQVGTNR